jgi:tRNA(Ile2) C34 agmatinyltransferase TiaS
MSEEFEDYFTEVENSLSQCTGGRDLYALKLVHKNYFRIKTGFYEDESPEEISNEICMSINEMVKDGKVTCNNCQWEWKLSEGGNDPYTCHKCGYKKNQLLTFN